MFSVIGLKSGASGTPEEEEINDDDDDDDEDNDIAEAERWVTPAVL